MKTLPLYLGKEAIGYAVALLDDEDYERAKWYRWRLHPSGYICTRGKIGGKTVYLHKFVMKAPDGMKVDHRQHVLLDCQKKDLRLATDQQNSANRRKRLLCRSPFKGVYWRERRKVWESYIRVDGHLRFLGSSADPLVCARLYNTAAREAFGPFAWLNANEFPAEFPAQPPKTGLQGKEKAAVSPTAAFSYLHYTRQDSNL